MNRHRLLVLVLAVLGITGCERPRAVRSVAANALPIASGLQTSAPLLEKRMALQLRDYAERAEHYDRQAALRSEGARLAEAEWRLRKDEDSIRRLNMLRSDDAGLGARVLAPAQPTTLPENSISTADLKKSVKALTTLAGPDRLDAADLIHFAEAVQKELEKIKAEADASPPKKEAKP